MRGYEGGRVQPRAECRRATRLLARSTARPARSTPVLVRHGSRVDSRMALRHIRCAVGDAYLLGHALTSFACARESSRGHASRCPETNDGRELPRRHACEHPRVEPSLEVQTWRQLMGRAVPLCAGRRGSRSLPGVRLLCEHWRESSFEMPSRGELITEGGSRVGRELRGVWTLSAGSTITPTRGTRWSRCVFRMIGSRPAAARGCGDERFHRSRTSVSERRPATGTDRDGRRGRHAARGPGRMDLQRGARHDRRRRLRAGAVEEVPRRRPLRASRDRDRRSGEHRPVGSHLVGLRGSVHFKRLRSGYCNAQSDLATEKAASWRVGCLRSS